MTIYIVINEYMSSKRPISDPLPQNKPYPRSLREPYAQEADHNWTEI